MHKKSQKLVPLLKIYKDFGAKIKKRKLDLGPTFKVF
jgi:hypothetical protein